MKVNVFQVLSISLKKNYLEKSSWCIVRIIASTASRTEDISGDRALLMRTTTPYKDTE